MELAAAGLQRQPFRTHGKPLTFVPYASQKAAFEFLSNTHANDRGLGLFQGPSHSGKTTIIRHFTESLPKDFAVSVIDGAGMQATAMLRAMLSHFGYQLDLRSAGELMNMVRVFVMQQTATGHAPLLVVENVHGMNPGALETLCELAALKVSGKSALRLILASDRSILPMVRAPSMMPVFQRLAGDFQLGGLTQKETANYLHVKLRSGGCNNPESVLPRDACVALHSASGGWPGLVDRLALQALAKAQSCPVRTADIARPVLPDDGSRKEAPPKRRQVKVAPEDKLKAPPRIIVTHAGKTLYKISLETSRLLIGRSEHNDLRIDHDLISRHHALFIRDGDTTFIMDLNSTNGTYVNSRRISNQVVIDADIVSIGDHRIKFIDPAAKARTALEGSGFNETLIAKTLGDVRNVLARKKTQALRLIRKSVKRTA